MKRNFVSVLAAIIATASFTASAERVHISTPSTSLVVDAPEGGPVYFLYYGDRLDDSAINEFTYGGASWLNAYPVYGIYPEHEAAFAAVHNDGNMTLDMAVQGVSRSKDNEGRETTTISLKDKVYPFYIDLNYRTYPGEEVIETWVEAYHDEKGAVNLTRFMSGMLPIRRSDIHVLQGYGAWGNEFQIDEAPLTHGLKVIKNKDGVRNSHTAHGEVMISLDGKSRENSGRVIGAALVYTGNYKLMFDSDPSDYVRFFAGINEENSTYKLKKGERFVTPALALSYSGEGLGGVSRNFHRWGRRNLLANGDTERKILLNSWEGVGVNIDEPTMHQMMTDIADMGGELFVMDDGWFGVKHRRLIDDAGLGDWTVDIHKLPHGIQGLIDAAAERGLKFGLWIEPEMVNSKSELFEAHPEYTVKAPKREPVYGRGGTQTVLDMSNPKVQDLVFNIVDTLMTNYPGLDYIKWDANCPIQQAGSQYLSSDNQSHLYIEYHKGLEKTLERIRAKYPKLTIQACASGGGRVNWGYMKYFDEFWASDNTDALQRIYMQWGTSFFFPAIAVGSHISLEKNHQTHRRSSLKFRTDVAMSGRLGMEMQPKDMTDAEKEQTRKAINDYKRIRDIVQFGDIYRLQSPFDKKGVASMMYVTPDKNRSVFYWWKTETFVNMQLPRIVMAGLDPQKNYRVTELNRIDIEPLSFEGKVFSGRFLMANGLEIPTGHNLKWSEQTDNASRVLLLEAL